MVFDEVVEGGEGELNGAGGLEVEEVADYEGMFVFDAV